MEQEELKEQYGKKNVHTRLQLSSTSSKSRNREITWLLIGQFSVLLKQSGDCNSLLSTLPLHRSLERWAEEGVGTAGFSSQLCAESQSQLSIRQLDGYPKIMV